jgi:hypothetical protein
MKEVNSRASLGDLSLQMTHQYMIACVVMQTMIIKNEKIQIGMRTVQAVLELHQQIEDHTLH